MSIATCKRIAKQDDRQAVVLITVARDGTVTVSSYGENRAKCHAIGIWAQGLWDHAVSTVPFRTIFGWGNDGTPLPLTPEERAGLSPAGRAYDDSMRLKP
jgi:hypothetical protein